MATTLAVKQVYGEDLDHALVQPLYKGYEFNGELSSVFVAAFRNLMGPTPQWAAKRPTSWKDWEKVQASTVGYPGWLDCIGQDAIDSAIPVTRPIYIAPRMVQNWWKQACLREAEVAEAATKLAPLAEALTIPDLTTAERRGVHEEYDLLLNTHFPQNFRNCEPTWGRRGCMCLNACWIEHVGDNPLGSGYQVRVPHHEAEADNAS